MHLPLKELFFDPFGTLQIVKDPINLIWESLLRNFKPYRDPNYRCAFPHSDHTKSFETDNKTMIIPIKKIIIDVIKKESPVFFDNFFSHRSLSFFLVKVPFR